MPKNMPKLSEMIPHTPTSEDIPPKIAQIYGQDGVYVYFDGHVTQNCPHAFVWDHSSGIPIKAYMPVSLWEGGWRYMDIGSFDISNTKAFIDKKGEYFNKHHALECGSFYDYMLYLPVEAVRGEEECNSTYPTDPSTETLESLMRRYIELNNIMDQAFAERESVFRRIEERAPEGFHITFTEEGEEIPF